jgi:autotransporter adhesin
VANGINDDDAVSIAQLRAAGAIDPVSGETLAVLTYDDISLGRATLGGTNGTVLANVANGLVASGSREAVNGGQLWGLQQDLQNQLDGLDGRVGVIETGIADGTIGGGDTGAPIALPGTGDGSVAIGDEATAPGTGSVAIGEGAKAEGEGAVAIGPGSNAGGDGSVAIGSGSTADRDKTVSVGSEGQERQVTNVAAGTRDTDAVNVKQLNDKFEDAVKYTDQRFNVVNDRIDRMAAMSGAYAGMALNTAGLEGRNRLGVGFGAQSGKEAMAIGYQRIHGEKGNISTSLGAAFSGSDQSISAGAGISW